MFFKNNFEDVLKIFQRFLIKKHQNFQQETTWKDDNDYFLLFSHYANVDKAVTHFALYLRIKHTAAIVGDSKKCDTVVHSIYLTHFMYFPDFLWPTKFPHLSQFSMTCRTPAL